MSDSPRTTLAYWQELQQTKCELAAAQVEIAALKSGVSEANKRWLEDRTERDGRIAELERERNYLVNVCYKARENCMEDNDCCAWLLLNQTCARYPSTGKSK